MRRRITQILYSGLSGVGAVVFSLIEADQKREVDWSLIFYGIEDLVEEYREKCKQYKIPFIILKKEPGAFDFSNHKNMFRFLSEQNPDTIWNHSNVSIFTCALYRKINKKVKLVSVEHQANELKRKKDWLLSRQLFNWSDKVICLRNSYLQELEQKLKLANKKEKAVIIPNGIDLNKFKKPQEKKKNDFHLCMISRLTAIKDLPTIFSALNLLKTKSYFDQLQFSVAGDGEKRKEWESKVQEMELSNQVKFMGMLSEPQLIELLHQSSVYVHSSAGETMSTAIMQAQAAGLAVIASRVKGLEEAIIEGKTGLLFEFQNPEELATILDKVLTDPLKKNELSEQAADYASQKYSNKKVLEAYLAL